MNCMACGERPSEGLMALCEDCKGRDTKLPWDRYLALLVRIREAITNGRELTYEDSRLIGNKYTVCSWGLCSYKAKDWPDPEDHLWPYQFKTEGRVAPKYRQEGQVCPLSEKRKSHVGCFYGCKIFTARRKDSLPTREETLQLYDSRIYETTEVIAKKELVE